MSGLPSVAIPLGSNRGNGWVLSAGVSSAMRALAAYVSEIPGLSPGFPFFILVKSVKLFFT